MRLSWEDEALRRLEEILARAPRQAERVVGAAERLVAVGFPDRYRLVPGRTLDRVMPVPPHAVIYRVASGYLKVVTVIDSRRRVTPW